MEKISGIIPSSARVTNVDMKDAQPVRSGVPAFGGPQAATRTGNNERLSSTDMMAGQPSWRQKDAAKAGIVNDVAQSFFMKVRPEAPGPKAEAAPEAPLAQPEGLFPKGSFIDRNA